MYDFCLSWTGVASGETSRWRPTSYPIFVLIFELLCMYLLLMVQTTYIYFSVKYDSHHVGQPPGKEGRTLPLQLYIYSP
jgi:hypothetical protein